MRTRPVEDEVPMPVETVTPYARGQVARRLEAVEEEHYGKPYPQQVEEALAAEPEALVNLDVLEKQLQDRLLSLATMFRALTYEEMIEFCRGIGQTNLGDALIEWAKKVQENPAVRVEPPAAKNHRRI